MRVLIVSVVVMAVFFGYMLVSVVDSIKEGEIDAIHHVIAGVSR